MYQYAKDAPCPFCHQLSIDTDDARQMCMNCGTILGIGAYTRPFSAMRPGEEFFHGAAVDAFMWRRAQPEEKLPPEANCYTLGAETMYGVFEPNTPVIRAIERRMLGSPFGYN